MVKNISKSKIIYFLLFLAASGAILITNISYDAEYQIAMGYRMLKGDSMLIEMWEPHQTSAFLCAFLMKLYMMITGTTTGIVLYLNVMGYLIRVGIGYFMYKIIRRRTGEIPALIAGFLYILVSPKDLLIPEFSNMELWFGTLTALFLIEYFEKKKQVYLVLSAVSLCLGVLSYPSFLIAYVAVIFLLIKYSGNSKRDILIYTGVCALIGGCFVIYVLSRGDLETLLNCLSTALALEPTHTTDSGSKLLVHGKSIATTVGTLGLFALAGLLAEIVRTIFCRKKSVELSQGKQAEKMARHFSLENLLIYSWYAGMIYFFIYIFLEVNTGYQAYPLIGILFLGFMKRKLLSESEQRIYHTAFWLGMVILVATVLLSDHPFIFSVPYMHLAVCFSVMPLFRWFEKASENVSLRKLMACGVQIFLILVVLRCIYVHVPMQGRGQLSSLFDDLGLIRNGPALGIVTNESGAVYQRDSYLEFQEYIEPGDRIWILGLPVDTLGYLYQDVEVAAPTVMSTPTYTEDLLYYWEVNPEKYPDVVIVSSTYGSIAYELQKCQWLMNWLEEEYQAETIIEGKWWNYYFKNTKE